MKQHGVLRIELLSSLAVGGWSDPRGVADHSTARDEQGRAFVPATALRGALRIELERLACSLEAEGETGTTAIVDRLFGRADDSGPEARGLDAEGRLRIGAAEAVAGQEGRAGLLALRPGVAVSRFTGSVEPQRLFFGEVSAPSSVEPLVLEAPVRWTSPPTDADRRYLEAACRAVHSIGGGRARGLGRVRVRYEDAAGAAEHRIGHQLDLADTATAADLEIEVVEPLLLGDGPWQGFFLRSLDHLPATAIRGAICWALIRDGVDCDAGEFRSFIDPAEGVRFGHAYPEGTEGRPAVTPATLQKCRSAARGGREGCGKVRDTLLASFAAARAAETGVGLCGIDPVRPCECPCCHGRLDSVPCYGAGVVRRTRTRIALDRHTGTAGDGQLYSMQYLSPLRLGDDGNGDARRSGLRFVTTLEGLRPEHITLLRRIAEHDVEVRIGKGRNQGMGRVRLRVTTPTAATPDAVRKRISGFDGALRACFAQARARFGTELALAADRCFLTLDLRSPFAAGKAGEPAPLDRIASALGAELGAAVRVEHAVLRSTTLGGFDQHPDRVREPRRVRRSPVAIDAGSVLLLSLPQAEVDGALEALVALGRAGLGTAGDLGGMPALGPGRFEICDVLHSETGDVT